MSWQNANHWASELVLVADFENHCCIKHPTAVSMLQLAKLAICPCCRVHQPPPEVAANGAKNTCCASGCSVLLHNARH
jgi:hypothetical protein